MSSLLALTAGGGREAGFRQDVRFAVAPGQVPPAAPLPDPAEPEDPLGQAFAEGFAAGAAAASEEAEAARQREATAFEALSLSFARLDADMAEALRERLTDTVMVLCEQTLVPFALDPEALARRVERAVAMFARADDERVIRLHPDDLALVAPALAAEWKVVPDPALQRGALRVETASGGVEDGPAQWRRALAEAFHAC